MLDEMLQSDGFALSHVLINETECNRLCDRIEADQPDAKPMRGGLRNILASTPEVRAWIRSRPVRQLVTAALSSTAFAVRSIYFCKAPEANWAVPWHRDETVPMQEATTPEDVTAAGLHGWSNKQGVPHAIAPDEVLDQMVSLRLHLDETHRSNGALTVLPGSHTAQGSTPPDIEPEVLEAGRGTVLLMRPKLWHSSSAIADTASMRRVLHIEFADCALPGALEWHNRW